MKRSFLLLAAVGSLAGFSAMAEGYVEPVYVVDVSADATLESATPVKVTQGGVTSDTTFGAISPTTGTFVKKGAGMLAGSTAMADFTGTFVIEEGAYVVSQDGMTGPANTTAGDLVVSNGATLVVAYTVQKTGHIYNRIHVAGTGATAAGCRGAVENRCTAAQTDYLFYSDWCLDGDATVYAASNCARIDWRGVSFKLQDHTLTLKGYDNARTFCFTGTAFKPGAGHIVVDSLNFQSQGGGTWEGGPTNTITFVNSSILSYYGVGAKADWTLVWDETGSVSPGSAENYNSGFGMFEALYWKGPLYIRNGRQMNINANNTNRGYTVAGPLVGEGNLMMRGGWLNLLATTNTSSGSLIVSRNGNTYESGLLGYSSKAFNPASAGVVLTNSPLALACTDRAPYDFPKLVFHVDAGREELLSSVDASASSYAVAAKKGDFDAVAAGLVKTGGGTLEILPAVAVTGTTEIAAGTVKIGPVARYSAAPGLIEGEISLSDEEAPNYRGKGATANPIYPLFRDRTPLTNRVVSLPFYAKQYGAPWREFDYIVYSGYVWNRSATNETWTFAGSIHDSINLYIDNAYVFGIYDSSRMTSATKTISPGAHKIDIYLWNYNGTTAAGAMKASGNGQNWRTCMGFAIDRQGRGTMVADDFVVPANSAGSCAGGDGFWFTRDVRAPEAFTAEEYAATRASFDHLILHADATLDIANATNFVRTLAGVGTVRNGGLAVKESWTVGLDDIVSGTPLTVDDVLVFGDGAKVRFAIGNRKPSSDRASNFFTIATAANGIVGEPEFESDSDRWHVRVSADGKSLVGVYTPPGLTVIVK